MLIEWAQESSLGITSARSCERMSWPLASTSTALESLFKEMAYDAETISQSLPLRKSHFLDFTISRFLTSHAHQTMSAFAKHYQVS